MAGEADGLARFSHVRKEAKASFRTEIVNGLHDAIVSKRQLTCPINQKGINT